MLNAFQIRKPWTAAVITLVLGPVIGMCYIGKGLLALGYLALSLILAIADFMLAPGLAVNPLHAFSATELLLEATAVIHVIRITRRRENFTFVSWYARWYALASFIILPLLLAGGFRHYIYEPFHIPSASMSPNVNQGDYLFAAKFAYQNEPPRRGDVVIFRPPKLPHVSYIKRVIGLPGDKVQMKDGMLYINDAQVPRRRIADFNLQTIRGSHTMPQFIETLPEEREYAILQEYTNGDLDNTPAYMVPPHCYFLLGDNRENSRDSRDQQGIGFVPEENITAKARIIYWHDGAQAFHIEPVK